MPRIITLTAQLHVKKYSTSNLLSVADNAVIGELFVGRSLGEYSIVGASFNRVIEPEELRDGIWYGNCISLAVEAPTDVQARAMVNQWFSCGDGQTFLKIVGVASDTMNHDNDPSDKLLPISFQDLFAS